MPSLNVVGKQNMTAPSLTPAPALTIFDRIRNGIGSLHGYGHCPHCGRNWWYVKYDNPGYALSKANGWMLCRECYARDKAAIDAHNYLVWHGPR